MGDNNAGSMTIVDGKYLHDEWCHYVIDGEACSCHVDVVRQLEVELKKEKEESNRLYGIGQDYDAEVKALRELFIDLLATQGLVTAKREVEIPEELSATLDIGLPLARRIVDALV